MGPAPALPASVEESYRQKCKEIKKRIIEIENSNDLLTSRIQRARRAVQRMRLERAFLLEQLEKRTDARVEDSEGSPSPPPTPSQKPLRVKRPRKDAPPTDSPMRQASESPGPRATTGNGGGAGDMIEYGFVTQSFSSTAESSMYILPGSKAPGKSPTSSSRAAYGVRTRVGLKRPPNAYMIFCERERDAVRERESSKDGFDMHKALAQAWRSLKPEGQKPYFEEYEEKKASYTQKVNELRDGQQGKRAGSVESSATAAPAAGVGAVYDRGVSPTGAGGSTNDEEADDHLTGTNGGDYGFTSVNRS